MSLAITRNACNEGKVACFKICMESNKYQSKLLYHPMVGIDIEQKNLPVYVQFSIETIHDRRKRNREFSGVFFSNVVVK